MEQYASGNWFARALEIGELLQQRLLELQMRYPVIGDVRGKGAMQAIELVIPGTQKPNPEATTELMKHCHQNGVVILNAGTYNNVIRFLPPLAISDELLEDALEVIAAGLAKIS
jgi:4-aminobutyrate aminotransferase/(S)-3-amino-2-methylpropionate transaminase